MNRELKFRVWNGSEMVYDVTVGKFGVFYVNPSNNGLDEKDSASLTPFNTKYSDTTPLMQFTGLKDKNGKEIYEGDVIKWDFEYDSDYDGDMPIVKRSQGKAEIKDIFDRARIFTAKQEGDGVEVIGNIYENPDLLK